MESAKAIAEAQYIETLHFNACSFGENSVDAIVEALKTNRSIKTLTFDYDCKFVDRDKGECYFEEESGVAEAIAEALNKNEHLTKFEISFEGAMLKITMM